MDYSLQKAVELGATNIIPFFSKRGLIKLDSERQSRRLKHWKGVLRHATEQSGRRLVPTLHPIVKITELKLSDKKISYFILDTNARLKFSSREIGNKHIGIISGPEGGFEQSEIKTLVERGACPVNLGPRILRSETSAACAISIAQVIWGDLGS